MYCLFPDYIWDPLAQLVTGETTVSRCLNQPKIIRHNLIYQNILIFLKIINSYPANRAAMKITTERENQSCCSTACRVEAILTVDERGQMVLPKDIRERAGIQPGGKLALISWEKDGEVCCISLINTGRLMGVVQEALSPMMKDLIEVTR